jgi:hypothetical protein
MSDYNVLTHTTVHKESMLETVKVGDLHARPIGPEILPRVEIFRTTHCIRELLWSTHPIRSNHKDQQSAHSSILDCMRIYSKIHEFLYSHIQYSFLGQCLKIKTYTTV